MHRSHHQGTLSQYSSKQPNTQTSNQLSASGSSSTRMQAPTSVSHPHHWLALSPRFRFQLAAHPPTPTETQSSSPLSSLAHHLSLRYNIRAAAAQSCLSLLCRFDQSLSSQLCLTSCFSIVLDWLAQSEILHSLCKASASFAL